MLRGARQMIIIKGIKLIKLDRLELKNYILKNLKSKVPINIGTFFNEIKKEINICYKTLQRLITDMAGRDYIDVEKFYGGEKGCTTIITSLKVFEIQKEKKKYTPLIEDRRVGWKKCTK